MPSFQTKGARRNEKGQSILKRKDGSMFQGLMSRSQKMAQNRLGRVHEPAARVRRSRSATLDKVYKYLEGCQYDHLAAWQDCQDESYIKVRDRRPRVIFPFAKIYQNRVASKLVGASTFPALRIEDDPDTEQFLSIIMNASFFKAKMLSAGKNLASYTSAFVRFKVEDGAIILENYNPNYCYPKFDSKGQLVEVEIKYVFESNEIDASGKPVLKWYRWIGTQESDTLYNEPEYKPDVEPLWEVVEQVDHGLGMVQGTWFRAGEHLNGVDGEDLPMVEQLDGFIDAINYNLSLSDSSSSYGMEPQLALKGLTEEEAGDLIKSAHRAWLLGREGDAKFLEVGGSGLEAGKNTREDLLKYASHAAQIVFLDPEKMAANAQSGKAMEVMHAALVEMVNELRPWMAKGMVELAQKILAVVVHYNNAGFETEYIAPKGWMPDSLDIQVKWPPIFPLTIQDVQQIVSIGNMMANANMLSRESAAKWVQAQGVDLGVEDWEAEVAKINGQKQFGGFF